MSASPASRLLAPFVMMRRHRVLIWAMAQRDITSNYTGQVFGVAWALLHPLCLVIILTVVFGWLLGARMPSTIEIPRDYIVYILAGLLPWQTFAIVLGRSGVEISGNANLVKQVVFPIEVLPVRGVVTSLTTLIVGMLFLCVYVQLRTGSIPWTYLLVPILLLLQICWMIGVAFLFSGLGVYFRDLKDFLGVFVIANLYLLPIVYVPEMIPEAIRPILYLNPFSYMIWAYQDVLYFGAIVHVWAWVIFAALSFGTFYGGYFLFQKLKPNYGDVL